VENAFGLLVARWRLLKSEINFKPENVENFTKACCVLHNCLQSDDKFDPNERNFDPETDLLEQMILPQSSRQSKVDGHRIREKFKNHFMFEYVLAWQQERVVNDGYYPVDEQ
jgi:hypothetical protein